MKRIVFNLSIASTLMSACAAYAAPTISVELIRGPAGSGPEVPPLLDENGDFQWLVQITPDAADAAAGNGVVEAEMAFRELSSGLVSVTNLNPAEWDHNHSGPVPAGFGSGFNWLALNGNNEAEGVQFNTTLDEAFAGLGSINFSTGDASTFLLVKTVGPSLGNTSVVTRRTSLEWGGAYSGAGRLVQNSTETFVSGSATYTALRGDANLDGIVSLYDFNTVVNHFGFTGGWSIGNFNNTKSTGGDTTVNLVDFKEPVIFFGTTAQDVGAGGIGIVPEPASLGLIALGVAATFAGRCSRNR